MGHSSKSILSPDSRGADWEIKPVNERTPGCDLGLLYRKTMLPKYYTLWHHQVPASSSSDLEDRNLHEQSRE